MIPFFNDTMSDTKSICLVFGILSLIINTCKNFYENKAIMTTQKFWKIKEIQSDSF